jgi:hypothetical protein
MSEHARHSPSGAARRFVCPGSLTLEDAYPNNSSKASEDGTCKHHFAAVVLAAPGGIVEAKDYVGMGCPVYENNRQTHTIPFTEGMTPPVQEYVDYVRGVAGNDLLMVEQRVEFGQWIEVPGQFGTADAIVVKPWADPLTGEVGHELIVIDAKFGYKFVPVEENPQLLYYALGAYSMFELSHDIRSVRLVIYQPEQGGEREWTCDLAYLLKFAQTARSREASVRVAMEAYPLSVGDTKRTTIWMETFLNPDPNDRDCAFCRAIPTCPAYRLKLERAVGDEFEVIAARGEVKLPGEANQDLALSMSVTDMLEDWIIAVRAETERRLIAANNDLAVCQELGYGLELGREGPRKWQDADAAEAELKRMRLNTEEMYDLKLISPTTAEKLATQKLNRKKEPVGPAPVIGPGQWKKLQKLVVRNKPKPSVKRLEAIKELYVVPGLESSDFGVVDEPAADDGGELLG